MIIAIVEVFSIVTTYEFFTLSVKNSSLKAHLSMLIFSSAA